MKKLTNRASIPELLKDMSLDEKLTLLTGRSAFLAGGCPERDIPNPLFLDGEQASTPCRWRSKPAIAS